MTPPTEPTPAVEPPALTVSAAVDRAARLAAGPGRPVLGITGPPGAGKSTLAARLAAAVEGAVVVGMDGFHLAQSVLDARGPGWVDRKGAPHTFDADGYVALLRRLRDRPPADVWAPEFRRETEDAVAAAVRVPGDCPLVITEGNYLLVDDGPWAPVAGLLDECWYVEVDDDLRRRRLAARHRAHGRSEPDAWAHLVHSDDPNASLVAATRSRATAVVSAGPP